MLWRPWIELTVRYDWLDNPGQAGQEFHAFTAGATVYAVNNIYGCRRSTRTSCTSTSCRIAPDIQDDVFLFAASLALEKSF